MLRQLEAATCALSHEFEMWGSPPEPVLRYTSKNMTTASDFLLQPGFMVVHGNRLEDLRDLVVEVVQRNPLPPLQPEVFLVQSNGMKHWLELALAQDDALGICAATRMELPSAFLWQMYRTVLGAQAVPTQMPFDKAALVWRLMRLLPSLTVQGGVYTPLQHYLASDEDGRKGYQLAQQVADVFDGYQSYRADWLSDWAAGRDVLATPSGSMPLPDDQAWQATLWREVLQDVGPEQAQASRSVVHANFMQVLQARDAQDRPAGLPQRIVVFGISALPMQTVEALAALGRFAQVLMVVQNPCRYYWGHVVTARSGPVQRSRQPTHNGVPVKELIIDPAQLHREAPPLLASWGQQGRDYLHLLEAFDQPEHYAHVLPRIDVFVPPTAEPGQPRNQLQVLQADMLELAPMPEAPESEPRNDGAIRLVTTHSAQRELEVLHDQILAWLDADPTLLPRDVMVMVPDMAPYASHIQAMFGRFASGQTRHVPFSVADTTSRDMPLVQALERLLSLPTSRISLADWLSIFEVAAVQKRFGLQVDDVQVLHQWVTDAGVRWGLDAKHRQSFGVPGIPDAEQNTWAFGLRRLLLGYANGTGPAWQGIQPLAEVGAMSAQWIGSLAEWLEVMHSTWQALSQAQKPADWVHTLQNLLTHFFEASDDHDERVLAQLQRELQRWLQWCQQAELSSELPLVVVREHWLSQIESPGLHQRFLGGGVQFATLMPMRSIPFKIVCLLGMNDQDYPRQAAPRDFDLMAKSWRAGDRSRREDDRYLFLEAILSARQKLYISWQGHRSTDHAEQPPSVLVSQLRDVLQARFADAPQPQQQPLQPFSKRYFEEGSEFSTYARDWQLAMHSPGGEACVQASRTSAVTHLAAWATPPAVLDVEALQRFLRQPVEAYWRQRLDVHIPLPEEAVPEDEPFELDGLAQYLLGQALLQGGSAEAALHILQAQGRLPLAAAGQRLGQSLLAKANIVRERAHAWQAACPEAIPAENVDLLCEGFRITGAVKGLWQGPSGCLQIHMRPGAISQGKPLHPRWEQWVDLWVAHVLLCAMGRPVQSVLLGIDGECHLPALSRPEAQAQLSAWLLAYQQAWQAPLPVTLRTALAYLHVLQHQREKLSENSNDMAIELDDQVAWLAVCDAFEGTDFSPGEWQRSAYVQRSFDHVDELAEGLAQWAQSMYGGLIAQVQFQGERAESADSEAA